MAAVSRTGNLLGLVDSESDDDLGTLAGAKKSGDQNTKNMATRGAKGRTNAAANKVTKPVQKGAAGQRVSGRVAAAIEQTGIVARQALADKTTNAQPAARRGRKAAVKDVVDTDAVMVSPPASDAPKAKAPRGRPKAAAKETREVPDSAERPAPARRGRKPAQPKEPEDAIEVSEVPETQEEEKEEGDEDEAAEPDAMDVDPEPEAETEVMPTPRRVGQPPASPRKPAASTASVRRPAPALDLDQSDSALRRRLGELTKKHESLEAKYRDLREIGIKEAERNFDKLRKQGEERTKSSNDLIASLKAEVAAQKELAKEAARFKKHWEASESKVDSLQAQVSEMTTSLSEARTEIKALSAKLAAARAAEAASKVPGSALKAVAASSLSRAGAAEALQASTQAAQMKEDLYGDLTGLIVRGVKRESDLDVYDCLQTGRNGTLHFKLTVEHGASGESYDETQFMYMPQLDPSRDGSLIDMLPDYLIEEITFPRNNAAKFYARVMKSLTEKLE